MSDALVQVRDLKMHFPLNSGVFGRGGAVKAVDGVSFDILRGETLGLVGESGCGKSTLGRSILRLIDPTGGQVVLDGEDITRYSSKRGQGKRKLRQLRKKMQLIFQDPYASLNPRMTVGDLVGEPMAIFDLNSNWQRQEKVLELLRKVGLSEDSYGRYPHEFSGGQRQRIGIARALSVQPELIVCDEPVSALDVSVRSQVLNLMQELQQELGLTYLFISHDLSVVKHISARVAVMYLGRIVELTNKDMLYEDPLHPYTQALLSAISIPDPDVATERIVLTGDVPSPTNPPQGCHFHPRCQRATERCRTEAPQLKPFGEEHLVACHLYC